MDLSYGTNCKDNNKTLDLISVDELYTRIASGGDQSLVDFTKNLRSVIKYSQERYRVMKTSLPFFSCSHFTPAQRSIKNFEQAVGLVIDIDLKAPVTETLLTTLKFDPRIVLGYISPSQMGIKLVFAFANAITDDSVYTKVYKYFSYEFGHQYQISDAIDQKNCDVSRISFLCYDPHAWYNPEYIHLEWETFGVAETSVSPISDKDDSHDDISPSAYRQILHLLDSKPKTPKRAMPMLVEITEILPEITDVLAQYDIVIKETESIQYGVKIKVYKDSNQGELNLYTGKQGYKVVSSPRKGTDYELNEVARHIIEGVLIRY
jgi:hypothetical protein